MLTWWLPVCKYGRDILIAFKCISVTVVIIYFRADNSLSSGTLNNLFLQTFISQSKKSL